MRAALLFLLLTATGCGRGTSAPTPEPSPAPAAPTETIPNPQFASWAKFNPGTRVVVRSTTASDGHEGKTSTTTATTLVEVTHEEVAVETQTKSRRYDGHEENNPPSVHRLPKELSLPPGMTGEQSRKKTAESGEETITVAGKEYRAEWHKGKDRNEGGEVFVQTWTSDAIPGRFLKSVSRTPAVGKTTTIEVIEVVEK
ncbi:MAG TPA: hypothetical protein VMZ71_14150 [Gemmataceae bacterium]|nr:hypothetical protein [Gemmataceae bacterium]